MSQVFYSREHPNGVKWATGKVGQIGNRSSFSDRLISGAGGAIGTSTYLCLPGVASAHCTYRS